MKVFLIICISLSVCTVYGQSQPCDSVYKVVDEMPIYKNKMADLSRDLVKTVHWEYSCADIYSSQAMTWTVTASGEMTDIKLYGFSKTCEYGIVEQLKKLKGWRPGKLHGRPVCVSMGTKIHVHWEK